MPSRISQSSKKIALNSRDLINAETTEKVGIFIKLDQNIVSWFKNLGPGYQRKMNEVLKRFITEINSGEPVPNPSAQVTQRAQELFEEYYEQCFWHMKPNLIVTENDLPQIIKGLKTYGGRAGYLEAAKLCH